MDRSVRIITADPDPRAAGHWLGDKACIIPMASDRKFVPAVRRIASSEGIHVILVGTDVELGMFARHRADIESEKTHVVVSSPEVVAIANDKWLTAEFLRSRDFPYPASSLARDESSCRRLAEEYGFPLFAKPRCGARSVGARTIRNLAELSLLCEPNSDLVVQEYLVEDEGEFTAGCLGDDNGYVEGIVVLRRDLRDGNTYRAYHDGTDRYEEFIRGVATALGVRGPCNFQFRVRHGKPVVFEINARFSGTTPLRALFGFNEVEAMLEHVFTGKPIHRPSLRPGVVLRAWSDAFIATDQLEQLGREQTLDSPRAEFFPFAPQRQG
jgi:carbamoyl-phosphate synthase large subunit